MRVQILLSAIEGYLPKYQVHGVKLHQVLESEITQKAREEWSSRQPGEQAVRFLQKMPAKHGTHFRFLEVTQKDEKTLLVSYQGSKQ